jgi:hypothetical protein
MIARLPRRKRPRQPTAMAFFARLAWIDGRPLLDTMEDYRRRFLSTALDTLRPDGTPQYNFVVCGRSKKNNKTTDLVLSSLYRLLVWNSPAGNDGYILASDEDQAGDDLTLMKKLIYANSSELAPELEVLNKSIRRRDGRGSLTVLPARDVAGSHGKTFLTVFFDEVHNYKNYDLFEALAPDPSRPDALTWVTSYASVYDQVGCPLHDFQALGRAGTDPRMLYSWYSGNECTDPDFANLEPELRANPSIASWGGDGKAYLDQQRRRLPVHKFRRLHLNLSGSPNNAYLNQASVLGAIVPGWVKLPYQSEIQYFAAVDMSGGSNDDSTFAISHKSHDGRAIIDYVCEQGGRPPFNPRLAVRKFAAICREYHCASVTGDAFGGETYRRDFLELGIAYRVATLTASELYEQLEPRLNCNEVELIDHPKLTEQLLTLVLKGSRITHEAGSHDDWANSCALAVWLAVGVQPLIITPELLARLRDPATLARLRPGRPPYQTPFRLS